MEETPGFGKRRTTFLKFGGRTQKNVNRKIQKVVNFKYFRSAITSSVGIDSDIAQQTRNKCISIAIVTLR